jgi:hypothetical protein
MAYTSNVYSLEVEEVEEGRMTFAGTTRRHLAEVRSREHPVIAATANEQRRSLSIRYERTKRRRGRSGKEEHESI